MKIIGFGHRKRTGKDTATRFAMSFARIYRPDLKIAVLSFGDRIKEICYAMYSWGGLQKSSFYENHPDSIEEILAPIGKTPRQIWDTVGLTGRLICDKTWTEMALESVDADLLIAKDVRGLSEFDLIKRCGITVRVNRPGAPRGGPVDEILQDAAWDVELANDAGLRELNGKIKELVGERIDLWFPRSLK